jgi:hypothetical protein
MTYTKPIQVWFKSKPIDWKSLKDASITEALFSLFYVITKNTFSIAQNNSIAYGVKRNKKDK